MSQATSDDLVQRLYGWGIRRVFGYPGDGAMQMPGNDGLATIAKYRQTWSDPARQSLEARAGRLPLMSIRPIGHTITFGAD